MTDNLGENAMGMCSVCDEMVYDGEGENMGSEEVPDYQHFDC